MATATTAIAPAWELKNKRLKFSLGVFPLFAVRVRTLVLNGIFAELSDDPEQTRLPLEEAAQDVRAALVLSHPTRAKLPQVAFTRGLIRYTPHQYRRFFVNLQGSFEEYLGGLSSRRSRHLRRDVKRFLAAGPDQAFREYSKPEEMVEYFRLARAVSAKTYQEQLADAGLPDSPEFLDELVELARRDAVRGYILFHQGAPVAYQHCPCQGTTLLYERVGYDPEHRRLGPGAVLLFLVLQHLFATSRFHKFDFGIGEFAYKKVFSSGSVQCADIYFFRRSWSNAALVLAHGMVTATRRAIGAVLDRMGWRVKLRKLLRSRYAS